MHNTSDKFKQLHAVADPGFPVVGCEPRRGATPEAARFRKFCMSKRKNLDPGGGGGVRRESHL